MRTGQLRALTRMPHRIALQRTACEPVPRTYANAPSYRVSAACVRANAACLRKCAIALQRHARAPTPRTYASAPSRCSGMRTGQLRALARMCHLTAFRRLACGPTPRTHTNVPSNRVSAACVRANSSHSRECPIALQRHARTNRICPRLSAAACAQSVLRMGFSRRRCPRVYAPCVSPCRVFARSAVSALCRPCAVRQTPLSRAATGAPFMKSK